MGDRIIFHIDVNSAFLSWEAVFRLKFLGAKTDLREIPAVIGGDQEKRRGIILAKSIPAKKFNIRTGESIMEAKRKCKDLYVAPPNYGLFERCSAAFMDILRDYSPDVEQYSIDEAFVDMTGTKELFGDPVAAAHCIKDRIREELGFTVNIGISNNKLLAKMASDFKKPDMVHTLFLNEIEQKMWCLPVSDLIFVGRATAKQLISLGIHTIGELADTDPMILRAHFKKQGDIMWGFANGIDISDVKAQPVLNKGFGNSTTIAFDVTDADIAKKVLLGLAETVAKRLRADNARAGVLAVGIRSYDMQYYSHQMVLPNATNITNEIYRYACKVFDEAWTGVPIRHLGIHTSRLKREDYFRQLDLFSDGRYEAWEKVDTMIDGVRDKYGIDIMKRAVLANGLIDHMSGGISREKRTLDYDKVEII